MSIRHQSTCSKCHQAVDQCAKMVRWAESKTTIRPVFCSRLPVVGHEYCRQHLTMLGIVCPRVGR